MRERMMEYEEIKKIIIVCLSILGIGLTGCGSKDAKTCKVVVEDFLKSYQTLDSNAGKYLANRTEDIKFNGIQALLAERITFSVKKVEKKEKMYIVSAQISTVDFKKAFETITDSVGESTSNEEILDGLYDLVKSKSAEMRTFSVEIPVRKYGKEYRIELTQELSNALFGGYNEYISELTGGMVYE